MRGSVVGLIAIGVFAQVAIAQAYRKQPCEQVSPQLACVEVHGRLRLGNGTPSTRLWHIGTDHVFGIFSNAYGFKHDDPTLDNEGPNLPANVEKLSKGLALGVVVYGDYLVCPLEPRIQGHMQAACIARAENLVAK
jgi:hypothetical protein